MRIVQNNSGLWCLRKTTQFRLENENSEPQMWDKHQSQRVGHGIPGVLVWSLGWGVGEGTSHGPMSSVGFFFF